MASLFTCSFSEYHPDMGVAVRITLGRPRNMKPDAEIRELAPHASYFKASEEVFQTRYLQQLDRYGVPHLGGIFTSLDEFGSSRPLILLCFERLNRDPFCHRRLFAGWWQEHTGQEIPELGAKPIRPTTATEPTLPI